MMFSLLQAAEFKVLLPDMEMGHYQSEIWFLIGEDEDLVVCELFHA